VSRQSDVDLGFTKEIEKYREHLLLCVVVGFKTWHIKQSFQGCMPFIAKVMQQVVVVVADDRPQNSWKILRIDRQIF